MGISKLLAMTQKHFLLANTIKKLISSVPHQVNLVVLPTKRIFFTQHYIWQAFYTTLYIESCELGVLPRKSSCLQHYLQQQKNCIKKRL
jgi:hypothetical protein